jgi:muconolactone delta-isomerase
MQFFIVFTPKKKFATEGMPADFPDLELQEQAQVRTLYSEGGLRQVWALPPKGRGGVVLFEAASAEHLEQIIQTFPLIKADYADYQVWGLAPYPAFITTP